MLPESICKYLTNIFAQIIKYLNAEHLSKEIMHMLTIHWLEEFICNFFSKK